MQGPPCRSSPQPYNHRQFANNPSRGCIDCLICRHKKRLRPPAGGGANKVGAVTKQLYHPLVKTCQQPHLAVIKQSDNDVKKSNETTKSRRSRRRRSVHRCTCDTIMNWCSVIVWQCIISDGTPGEVVVNGETVHTCDAGTQTPFNAPTNTHHCDRINCRLAQLMCHCPTLFCNCQLAQTLEPIDWYE